MKDGETPRRIPGIGRELLAVAALAIAWTSNVVALDSSSEDESRRVALVARIEKSVVLVWSEGRAVAHEEEQIALEPSQSVGTGVLVAADGLVLTAAHVVEGAERIQIRLFDGVERPARIVFSDGEPDLALLRMDTPPARLVPARLGDSDRVRKGEAIYVIGNPAGIESSLSVGVVSGRRLASRIFGGSVEAEIIQTDAAINAGNSGGPMFNSRGEVIGIAQRILTEGGGSEGLGFGLAIKSVKKILRIDPCIWLGFSGVPLPASWASALNVTESEPVLIERVAPGGPAEQVGLRGGTIPIQTGKTHILLGGDIILKIDGRPPLDWIRTPPWTNRKPGARHEVRLTVLRAGTVRDVALVTVHREGW
jgi:S1-C subfamily serine protease